MVGPSHVARCSDGRLSDKGKLLGLPHIGVLGYQIPGNGRTEVQIRSSLEAALCPDWQQISTQIHDTAAAQTLRDLPIWDRQRWLRFAPRRFACMPCGRAFVKRVPWRTPGGATRRAMPSTSMLRTPPTRYRLGGAG
jgi:hypothetical protein